MSYYKVAVEATERNEGGSNAKYRVHPLAGQGFNVSMNVECSRSIREEATNGNVIIIWAKETNRENGTPFLYSHHRWLHQKVSKAEAEEMIREGRIGREKQYSDLHR